MKKFFICMVLFGAFLSSGVVYADEIEEDYLDIAGNYCVVGDYSSALEYLDKILTINPNNQKVLDLKKGLSHVIAQDKKSYITSVNPYVKDSQSYRRLGNEKMEYSSLISGTQEKNSYLAYYYLGNFYREKNDFQRAIDAYNQALSANPDFAQVYLASAITLFDLGRYESALNPIDKYLTLNPNDDLAYALRARTEFQLGMTQQAKEDNDKAIELNDCPEYQFDRAKILYKSGEFQKAKEIFQKLLPQIQTSKIYEYISYCDLEMKNYLGALDNINKALILSNDDEYLLNKYNEIKQLLEDDKNEQE